MINKLNQDLKSLTLRCLSEKETLNIQDIVQAAGLPLVTKSRRRVQRALNKLIHDNMIEPHGHARARVYKLKTIQKIPLSEMSDLDQGHGSSSESVNLLRYLSQPLIKRKSVGYHQDFLKKYIPNKTFYLNEAQREALHLTGRVEYVIRPAGTYARQILNRLLIDLSWNSSRLEGNTYSLLETKRLIEFGENAVGKDVIETQMIVNHKAAIEYIIDLANEKSLTAHEICSVHALLSENLLGDESASGRLRRLAVNISGTTYLPLDNPHILKECFDIFIEKFNLIKDSFEQSFFALVHLSYLQAFEDVNKRTSRLVANIPLIKNNLKPLSFVEVNQTDYVRALLGVYEVNDVSLLRDLFVWAYQKSAERYTATQQSMGMPDMFKLKHRENIIKIIRKIILERISGDSLVPLIRQFISELGLHEADSNRLFQIIETEIMSLHDGNIARFKIKPSEFAVWRKTF